MLHGKKRGNRILLEGFALIICLSGMLWFFLKDTLDSGGSENRRMSGMPVLSEETYGTFPEDFTSFFNDHMPFRSLLVSLNSAADYFCFGRSASEDVAAGKDGWLFYCKDGDGDPIACYQGTNLYTEEELSAIADNCVRQRDYLASLGKEFVVFVAPNKERVYPEFMPERYGQPAEEYAALQIVNYLQENTDLRVVYAYDALTEAKEQLEENLYYRTDTHWNYIGGYIGASVLLKELGISMPAPGSGGTVIREEGCLSGDLAGMLNLKRTLRSQDTEYRVEGYDRNGAEEEEWDHYGLIRYRAAGADPRSIYILRDSFCSHMAAYIGSQFRESTMRHINSFSAEDLAECDPDIVVYETVERYAGNLLTFSVMPEA